MPSCYKSHLFLVILNLHEYDLNAHMVFCFNKIPFVINNLHLEKSLFMSYTIFALHYVANLDYTASEKWISLIEIAKSYQILWETLC